MHERKTSTTDAKTCEEIRQGAGVQNLPRPKRDNASGPAIFRVLMSANLPLPILIAVVAVIVMGGLVLLLARRENEHPYEAADLLLTPTERKFFRVLLEAAAPELHVFAKVRLADVIRTERGLPRHVWRRAFNRICNKHVDFVACDPETFQVLLVIELDDPSHDTDAARKKDRFKDDALAAAAIPILRVPTQRGYAVREIREDLFAMIGD